MFVLKLSVACVVLCLVAFATRASSETQNKNGNFNSVSFGGQSDTRWWTFSFFSDVPSESPAEAPEEAPEEAHAKSPCPTTTSPSKSPATKKKETTSVSAKTKSGKATSSAVAKGSHSASAKSSAVAGPKSTKAKSSSSVDGRKQMASSSTKTKSEGDMIAKLKKTKTDLSVPICKGTANLKCCGDRSSWVSTKTGVYCACVPKAFLNKTCRFQVVSQNPIVVKCIMGCDDGRQCRCASTGYERYARVVI
eukprot:g3100.t1